MALDAAGTGARAVGVRPATKPLGLWQSYRTARRNVLELIPEIAYREPVLTGGKNPGWVMVTEPEALERVFKTRAQAYIKSGVMKRLMRPRRGENLAIADHATARWQRRAMMETQIVLASILARFRLSLPAGFTPEPKMWFTLHPATGMPLDVAPRG